MKVISINYQKVFPLGQYVNERVGIEIQLDEGDGEFKALDEAKRIVEQWHHENNPQLYETEKYVNPIKQMGGELYKVYPPLEPIEDTPTPDEELIKGINLCETVSALEKEYRYVVKNNPELQQAYDEKLKALSK